VFRLILTTVIACVAIVFAIVQFASDGLYWHRHEGLSLRIYRALDRIAPAEYVTDTLGNAALAAGDLDAAQRYAVQMPAGERRDDLLAQIAAARGEPILAREYYFVASDSAAMQQAIAVLARTDIFGALGTEARFRDWLLKLQTHPDAVAESDYYSGNYEMWLRRYAIAVAFDERAIALAPLNMGYLLSAGTNALLAGDLVDAQRFYAQGVAVDPGSGDAIAGLGVVALRRGDRASAIAYLAQARAVDPNAPTVASLAAALR
jgi:tetratricopeptide (TPR) repeat protein